MKWSGLKQRLEALLCDSLKDRIRYYYTGYGPGDACFMNRAWITLDGREIENFSTVVYWIQHYELRSQLIAINPPGALGGDERKASYLDWDEAELILRQKGAYGGKHFLDAVWAYLELSIADALQSDDEMIIALAQFDRRLGKRRLRTMSTGAIRPGLVARFHEIRCQADHIGPPE